MTEIGQLLRHAQEQRWVLVRIDAAGSSREFAAHLAASGVHFSVGASKAVSGYWHTLTSLAQYCRVRSYLLSACNHSICSIDAIHDALTGNSWLPVIPTA